MKLTFKEFARKMYKSNYDSNPFIIQDDWVHQVEESIHTGVLVSDRVLNCHDDIYFDQAGHAHYRNKNRKHNFNLT